MTTSQDPVRREIEEEEENRKQGRPDEEEEEEDDEEEERAVGGGGTDYRSILMNSYQLQQHREHSKEVGGSNNTSEKMS